MLNSQRHNKTSESISFQLNRKSSNLYLIISSSTSNKCFKNLTEKKISMQHLLHYYKTRKTRENEENYSTGNLERFQNNKWNRFFQIDWGRIIGKYLGNCENWVLKFFCWIILTEIWNKPKETWIRLDYYRSWAVVTLGSAKIYSNRLSILFL